MQLLRSCVPVRCSAVSSADEVGHRLVRPSVRDRALVDGILASSLRRRAPTFRETCHAHGSRTKCRQFHDFHLRLGDHCRGRSGLSPQMAVPTAAAGCGGYSDRSAGADQRHFRPQVSYTFSGICSVRCFCLLWRHQRSAANRRTCRRCRIENGSVHSTKSCPWNPGRCHRSRVSSFRPGDPVSSPCRSSRENCTGNSRPCGV